MTTDSRPRLSKSRFVAGWFCPNWLWWRVHEPDAIELQADAAGEDLMEQGQRVGELARDRFPGGVLIDLPYDDYAGKIAATRRAIDDGAPAIFEASFDHDGVFVAVDVLERDGAAWNAVEVKAANRVKHQYAVDAAIQLHVLRGVGLDIGRVELMHLNPEYVHPGHGDLFVREDITVRCLALLLGIPDEIEAQRDMLAGPAPGLPFGDQCIDAHGCPFHDRCWPDGIGHVLRLHGKGVRRALELMAEGYHEIRDLPDGHRALDAIGRRQKLAFEAANLAVEPALARALDPLAPPLGFLDFETVARAIPVWDGLKPWGAIPVQFSYHRQDGDGALHHTAWLADGPGDPRPALARALVEACLNASRVLTYTGFEKRQIDHLIQAVPELAYELDDLRSRLFDLHPVVRNHLYHPDFRGSFSIKAVLPVLVPELGYDDLAIAEGMTASVKAARLMLQGEAMDSDARATLRTRLLEYCAMDTLAMVRLLERLRVVAGMAREPA